MRTHLIEPSTEQVLRFCAAAPIERVFLEDVARRAQGRFAALAGGDGELTALCHLGSNLVPSGTGCGAFADLAGKSGARMLIGEADAVTDLWEAARKKLPKPRLDRPGQPVYAIADPPPAGDTGLRPATVDDLDLLVPSCAAAHHEELGVDPLRRDPERLPLAHPDADRGRALVALGGGGRDPVQGRGVRLDAGRDPAPAGVDRPARAQAGLRRHGRSAT